MDLIPTLIVIGFLLFFAFVLYLGIRTNRDDSRKRQQILQTLGFVPVEADQALTSKISHLYQRPGVQNRYQLCNVSRRAIPDGEMYLFDLGETSSDGDTSWERQVAAIISPYLNLPHFVLFPKADQKFALSGLTNRVLEWGISKLGTRIEYPEFPTFDARYVVTSMDEPGFMRAFLDDRIAQYFSQTQMYMLLHGMGNIFTFAEIDPHFKPLDQERMGRRVSRALEIFRLFQKL